MSRKDKKRLSPIKKVSSPNIQNLENIYQQIKTPENQSQNLRQKVKLEPVQSPKGTSQPSSKQDLRLNLKYNQEQQPIRTQGKNSKSENLKKEQPNKVRESDQKNANETEGQNNQMVQGKQINEINPKKDQSINLQSQVHSENVKLKEHSDQSNLNKEKQEVTQEQAGNQNQKKLETLENLKAENDERIPQNNSSEVKGQIYQLDNSESKPN